MSSNNHIERLTKFLLPVDKDAVLDVTASTAGAMASVLGERVTNITLLHVMAGKYLKTRMMNIDFRVDFVLDSKIIRDLREKYANSEVKSILEEVSGKIKNFGVKAPVEYRIEDGDPVNRILSVCEDEQFSTIIMSRRGLSPLKQIFLGSVSAGVLNRNGGASVYLVGQEAISRGECPVARTVIAVDGSDKSLNALREASILYKACMGRLEQVTVLSVIDLANYSDSVSGGKSPEMEAKFFLDKAKMMLVDEGIPVGKIDTQPQYGHPAEVIAAEAEKRDAQMIFMGKTGMSKLKGFVMGSVSRGVIHKCVSRTIVLVP